ncbi:MAG: hypothetical protein K2P92_02360, partial [Bdellovibrionaceae bacterium]|nr:hypothetical protein [Pseudobdellovibrionaceae bacterium]
TDRAGNYHPAKGYAKLHSKLQNLNSGCAEMKEKLGVDVMTLKFVSHFFTSSTDPVIVAQQAAAKVGEVKEMKAEQYFSYQDENGNLPFFPLMHSETIKVESQYIPVDTAKAYNIWLYEDGKVQLTEMILKYLKSNDTKKILYSQLIGALVDHLPEFETNLKVYLPQVLAIFTQLEENHAVTENGFNWDANLSTLASDINALTHKYPAYYQFKIPQLVSQHPSLLDIISGDAAQAFPNMSAQDLEIVVDLIDAQLAQGQMNVNIKSAYKEKLKYMAGHFSPGGKLGNLASKYVKQKAQEILKNYY